jgi:multidrug efflux system membrane fusion protein
VGVGALESQLEYAGEVRARVESRLGFRVAGKIVQRQAELGQRVKAGDVLAQLDPKDYQLAAEAARAQLAAATTQRDLAAADYKRYAALKDQNFISGAELERRDTALKAAQATLDQAQAQLASQGNQAAYTRLVADAAGVVTGIDAEPGQVVAAGTRWCASPRTAPRDVVFAVPEDKVAAMAPGQEVAVRGWAGGKTLAGKVREVAASADAATRTFQVKVAMDRAEAPAAGLHRVRHPQGAEPCRHPAIKLPTTALRQEGQGHGGVGVRPGHQHRASRRSCRCHRRRQRCRDRRRPDAGMQVVATGVHVLSPGQKVTVYSQKRL